MVVGHSVPAPVGEESRQDRDCVKMEMDRWWRINTVTT